MIKKFVVAAFLLICGTVQIIPEPVHAAGPPKSVPTWAWCGADPDDPHAAAIVQNMALFAGIDATFGPCKDAPVGYTPAFPRDRYATPDVYMRLVVLNASAGMKTVVYDARIWSDDAVVRSAAISYWRPVYDHIAAWDMGDEYDPDGPEWQLLISRTTTVLSYVTPDSRIQPYTNHIGPAVDKAILEVPGSTRMLSFDSYPTDGGESIAKSVDARVQTLMCAVNTYDFDGFHPNDASIRDTTDRLVKAGCDMILVFGGAQVYDSTIIEPQSIIDAVGEPTTKATAALESTGYSSYVPVAPARLLETRVNAGSVTVDGQSNGIGVLPTSGTTVLQIAGRAGVRPDAASVVVNITAVNAALPGFVTAYPCDAPQPNASQLTYARTKAVATTVIVKLSAAGTICLFNFTPTDLIVDVAGYYPVTGTTFSAVQPARLLETRTDAGLTTIDGQFAGVGVRGAGSMTQLTVVGRAGVPVGATSATLSVTVTNAEAAGFVTVYPCQQDRPPTSSVNYPPGAAVTTNAVVSGIASNGFICIYTSVKVDLVVDLNGFSGSGASFVPVVPQRLLDSRTEPKPKPAPGSAGFSPLRELRVAGLNGVPADAKAVVLNLTVTESTTGSYVTVFPCGTPQPVASVINFAAGDTVSNMVVAGLGPRGSICFYSPSDPSYVIDLTAYHP